MSDTRIQSFEEFWPFYVREHSHKATRLLHFLGTTGALACLATAILKRRPALLLLVPVVGYGPSWFAHFFIEKNRPATFKYPLWSLRADMIMYARVLAGTMDEEVARVIAEAENNPASANGKSVDDPDDTVARARQTMN